MSFINPFFVAAVAVADPNFANVVFLCHADGTNGQTTFTNVVQALGRGTTISNGGAATVSTTAPLFGTGSVTTGAGGGNLNSASVADYNMSSGDWTIEFALKTSSPSQSLAVVIDLRGALGNLCPEIYIASGQFRYYNGSDRITGGSVATSTWQRVAVCKASGTTRMFLDGTQIGSNYTDSNTYIQGAITIGNAINGAAPFSGLVDEIRITKGVARYITTYTPDVAAFPDS